MHDRKQFYKVNHAVSGVQGVRCGVPQGFTLEPLLCLLYVNDLQKFPAQAKLASFADDTNLSWLLANNFYLPNNQESYSINAFIIVNYDLYITIIA